MIRWFGWVFSSAVIPRFEPFVKHNPPSPANVLFSENSSFPTCLFFLPYHTGTYSPRGLAKSLRLGNFIFFSSSCWHMSFWHKFIQKEFASSFSSEIVETSYSKRERSRTHFKLANINGSHRVPSFLQRLFKSTIFLGCQFRDIMLHISVFRHTAVRVTCEFEVILANIA